MAEAKREYRPENVGDFSTIISKSASKRGKKSKNISARVC